MLFELDAESGNMEVEMNTVKIKVIKNLQEMLNIKVNNAQTESEYIYLGQIIKPRKKNQEAEINHHIRV